VQSLELQLAGRYDKYVLRGARSESTLTPTNPIVRTRSEATSVNPTVGLKYQPLQDVFFRVSYGTGFAPPAINQLATNAPVAIATGFTDPLRGNQTTGVPNLYMGGNPDLTPEESKSRAAGLVFTPRWVQGLRLSVDYVWIHKTDNIATHPLGAQGIINDAALFPGRVVRDTNPATFGSFGVGPILSVDNTLLNIAEAKFEAADVQLDYQLPTASFGTFGFSLMGTRQVHAQSRLIESRPLVENVGVTFNNPPKYKANSSLTWSLRGWSAGWTSRYVDAYQVSTTAATILNQGGLMVAPQTYHDVSASYSFDHDARLLSDLEVRLGVTNVFNKEPPYDAFFSGGFYYSPYGDPRLRTYNISLRKSF
jgi:outer membrane receptor protein involved in Fe transport